jgi:hypothetical protein
VGQRDQRKAKERIYAEVAESTEVTEKRNPRAQTGVSVPQRAQRRGTQEHRQECLCHREHREEEPKSTDRSVCATESTEKRNPRAQTGVSVPQRAQRRETQEHRHEGLCYKRNPRGLA